MHTLNKTKLKKKIASKIYMYFYFSVFLSFIEKDSDAGRDWGQEKKGMTEDEMAGWHH